MWKLSSALVVVTALELSKCSNTTMHGYAERDL